MRIRVLVVDDDPVVCESLSIMLSDCGYAAVTADSGRNALAQIENSQFDLVLSDYRMPEMNGEELAEKIRIRMPELPVIIVTGGDRHPSSPQIALVLQKPFSIKQLREAVDFVT